MRRPKRAPSSATIAAQNTRARADFYASAQSPDLIRALGVVRDATSRVELVRCGLRDAYLAGGETEADLRTAIALHEAAAKKRREQLDAANEEIERLRALLKEARDA